MSRNSVFSRLLVIGALLGLVLSACAAPTAQVGQETASPAAEERSLVIGLATEPVSLDPAAGLYIAEQFLLMNIYDPLIWADQELNLHPGLATDWSSSEDGTEFTLNLRQDVVFHDGTPFNADAVKFAFDRALNPTNAAATAPTLLAGYVETKVVDEDTVVVRFDIPKPTFLEDLTRVWLMIPSPAAVEQWGEDYGQHPVGTGPFVFQEWAAQDHITLTRNPDYNWGPEFSTHSGPARLSEITFRFLPEAATRLTALQSGEAQVVEEPAYQEAASLAEDPAYRLETFTAPGMTSHMMINVEKAPTDDILVRQALIYAVNQEELVQTAFFGMQNPAHSVLSPTTWSYDEQAASLYSYDPERAAELLDEAGWVDSDGDGIREKDGQKLTIDYPALPAYEEAYMELLAAYLNQAGFEVTITRMDDAGIYEYSNAGNHNIVNMGWISRDPSVLSIVYHSDNIELGSAFTRFRSEELDSALEQAAVSLDSTEREELYRQAQQIIMENALVIPVHTYNRVMLMQAGVQGWRFDAEGFPYLYEVTLEP